MNYADWMSRLGVSTRSTPTVAGGDWCVHGCGRARRPSEQTCRECYKLDWQNHKRGLEYTLDASEVAEKAYLDWFHKYH